MDSSSFRGKSHNGGGGNINEALLIDFTSPPSSPSLAASGSDGMSVNSLGSESSGGFLDLPSSWGSNNTGKQITNGSSTSNNLSSSGFESNFDPFGSIAEETSSTSSSQRRYGELDDVKVGSSSFYSNYTGPCYDSNVCQSQSSTVIDWSKASNNSSVPASENKELPPDPFSPLKQPLQGGDLIRRQQNQLQQQQQSSLSTSVQQSNCNSTTIDKPKKVFRPTVIRPKATSNGSGHSFVSNDASISNSSNVKSVNKSSVHHSSSSQTSLYSAMDEPVNCITATQSYDNVEGYTRINNQQVREILLFCGIVVLFVVLWLSTLCISSGCCSCV